LPRHFTLLDEGLFLPQGAEVVAHVGLFLLLNVLGAGLSALMVSLDVVKLAVDTGMKIAMTIRACITPINLDGARNVSTARNAIQMQSPPLDPAMPERKIRNSNIEIRKKPEHEAKDDGRKIRNPKSRSAEQMMTEEKSEIRMSKSENRSTEQMQEKPKCELKRS